MIAAEVDNSTLPESRLGDVVQALHDPERPCLLIYLLMRPLMRSLIYPISRKPSRAMLSQVSAPLALPEPTQPRYPTGTC